jgi:hypothetical protein
MSGSTYSYKLTLTPPSPTRPNLPSRILVPLLEAPAVQNAQRPTGQSKTRSLVHRLFANNPESLQDTTSTGLEEPPETIPALANNRGVRQTRPDSRPSRPRTSAAHSQTEKTSASMVPPNDAAARSRRRILRLNHIQRSRRNRRPTNSRLFSRHESSLNDHSAGKPRLNRSITHQPEQFCGKRQPELFALPTNR